MSPDGWEFQCLWTQTFLDGLLPFGWPIQVGAPPALRVYQGFRARTWGVRCSCLTHLSHQIDVHLSAEEQTILTAAGAETIAAETWGMYLRENLQRRLLFIFHFESYVNWARLEFAFGTLFVEKRDRYLFKTYIEARTRSDAFWRSGAASQTRWKDDFLDFEFSIFGNRKIVHSLPLRTEIIQQATISSVYPLSFRIR